MLHLHRVTVHQALSLRKREDQEPELRPGNQRKYAQGATSKAGAAYGRQISRNQGTEFVIHRPNVQIRERDS